MSCHHLWSEHVEVEGMHMPEVEGMYMVEEQDHLTNHRLGDEGMNMVDINMVKVEGMDTTEEHFHPMNHRLEVESMEIIEKHFHPMNHRSDVEGMYTMDTDMGGDRAAELEVVEREPEGTVLMRHWIGDGAARHHRTHRSGRNLRNRGVQKINPRL
jgi:hypothetical protein